ncbi:uncharacterized protein LOC113789924 isoform X2 [Dermatophagoides pteronyssinus]|uniref:uncharacterized protein LOC113789924 isoform X2 n=1 Tax=Dermatophagoides pteronyssinus TaxID=6956 RepID=UPI003F67CCB4
MGLLDGFSSEIIGIVSFILFIFGIFCLRTFIKSNTNLIYWASILGLSGFAAYKGIEQIKYYIDKSKIEASKNIRTIDTLTTTVEPRINQKQCEDIFRGRSSSMIGKCCMEVFDCHCLDIDHYAISILATCPRLQEKKLDVVCYFMGQRDVMASSNKKHNNNNLSPIIMIDEFNYNNNNNVNEFIDKINDQQQKISSII